MEQLFDLEHEINDISSLACGPDDSYERRRKNYLKVRYEAIKKMRRAAFFAESLGWDGQLMQDIIDETERGWEIINNLDEVFNVTPDDYENLNHYFGLFNYYEK